jgi:hypothetical protein
MIQELDNPTPEQLEKQKKVGEMVSELASVFRKEMTTADKYCEVGIPKQLCWFCQKRYGVCRQLTKEDNHGQST